MGLMVYHYSLPAEVTLEALLQRVQERVGRPCTLKNGVLRCRALAATVELIRTEEGLEVEVMMPALPYFMLQVGLAAAELGGQAIDLVSRQPHGQPPPHPHAELSWDELPVQTRWQQGWAGSLAISLVAIMGTALILLTLPLQLLMPERFKTWLIGWISPPLTRLMLRR